MRRLRQVAVVVTICAIAMTACGRSAPQASANGSEHTDASGCSIGHLHLSGAPSTTSPGATVELTATALPGNDFVIEDVGTIGTLAGERYQPLWIISLDASGKSGSIDTQVTGSTKVEQNGQNIANNVFAINLPQLPKGKYQVRFVYDIPPAGTLPSGLQVGSYTLCAPLTVT
ncbi:MAG: hypothetical protein ACLPQS_11150 [Acidimicrobiales bacterium]